MARRSRSIQDILNILEVNAGINPNFRDASDHPYGCRCEKCREYWQTVGPDPDTGRYGPFSRKEIRGK